VSLCATDLGTQFLAIGAAKFATYWSADKSTVEPAHRSTDPQSNRTTKWTTFMPTLSSASWAAYRPAFFAAFCSANSISFGSAFMPTFQSTYGCAYSSTYMPANGAT
jgi:hypothetical protein